MTATAADLQTEFRRRRDIWRETGRGKYQTRLAYDAWFHQACLEGNPPDALDPKRGSDVERFFARTIPGVDGHTYWQGSLERGKFQLDSGHARHPRWWWYEHVNGPQERGRLGAICGESNCITPDHQRYLPWSEVKRCYTDEQMLGALQVIAQRLGRAPTMHDYEAAKIRPSRGIIQIRFGSWLRALDAAGLTAHVSQRQVAGEEQCFAALHFVARLIGHAPTEDEFRAHNRELQEAGLHSSPSTIYRCIGSWPKALKMAGLIQ